MLGLLTEHNSYNPPANYLSSSPSLPLLSSPSFLLLAPHSSHFVCFPIFLSSREMFSSLSPKVLFSIPCKTHDFKFCNFFFFPSQMFLICSSVERLGFDRSRKRGASGWKSRLKAKKGNKMEVKDGWREEEQDEKKSWREAEKPQGSAHDCLCCFQVSFAFI